jgi:hypothetical protein
MITPETTVVRIEEIVSIDIDGETVMMSVENSAYYVLDDIGSRIWTLIKNPCKVSGLMMQLTAEYKMDGPACEQDVLKFLMEIQKAKLIRVQ